MNRVDLIRIKALDKLEGEALDKQLIAIVQFIDQAQLKEITKLEMFLDHYHGPHKESLEQNIERRKSIKPKIESQNKESTLWRWLGFGRIQSQQVFLLKTQQEQLKLQQQTQPTKNHSQSKIQEKRVQYKSSLHTQQEQEQSPFFTEHLLSEDALNNEVLGTKQEKIEKDQKYTKSKLKTN